MEDILEGKWKQLKGRVQEEWGDLTDDDLDMINGSRTRLEGKIQERYGRTRAEARAEIDDWLEDLEDEYEDVY